MSTVGRGVQKDTNIRKNKGDVVGDLVNKALGSNYNQQGAAGNFYMVAPARGDCKEENRFKVQPYRLDNQGITNDRQFFNWQIQLGRISVACVLMPVATTFTQAQFVAALMDSSDNEQNIVLE